MNTRIFAFLCALCIGSGLAGCDKQSDTAADTDTAGTPEMMENSAQDAMDNSGDAMMAAEQTADSAEAEMESSEADMADEAPPEIAEDSEAMPMESLPDTE